MHRVYTFIGRYRYYWSGSKWTLARWQAKAFTLDKAVSTAKAFNAEYEEIYSNTAYGKGRR
uniref:Uncharacterized protein n=1 Tax=viral metagenome TaxID=1070528 RepID=A0A6M3LM27_9ZZZZ